MAGAPAVRQPVSSQMEFALVSSGDVAAADALAQVAPAVKSGDRYQIRLAASFVQSLHERVLPDELRPKLAKMAREVFGPAAKAMGLRAKPEEDHDERLTREALLEVAGITGGDPALRQEARRLAEAWLANHRAVGKEELGTVLALAAEGGDPRLHDQLAALALQSKDAEERATVFDAMAHFRAPELVEQNLELMVSGKIDLREAVGPFVFRALDGPRGRDACYGFVKAHYDELLAKMPVGQQYCDAAHRQDVVSYLTPRAAKIPGGPMELSHVVETIDSCIALRERPQASAAAFLDRY